MVRVASWNIRNGRAFDGVYSWPLRKRRLGRLAARLDCDIIGAQEAFDFQRRYLLRKLPEHRAVGVGRDGDASSGGSGEACPIFHRVGLPVTATWTRWFGESGLPGSVASGAEFPRIATALRTVVDGHPVTVVNTHLDAHAADARRAAMRQLLGWLDLDQPTIVLGDLNCRPEDEPVAMAAAAGLSPILVNVDTGRGFNRSGRGGQIDHILCSAHWRVASSGVMASSGRAVSDHVAVMAQLALD